MSLRIAVDLDGVLADLDTACRAVVERLFGPDQVDVEHRQDDRPPPSAVGNAGPADAEVESPAEGEPEHPPGVALSDWQEDEVWREIRRTPDFWTTLEPLEPGILMRLHALAQRHHWEIFFVTHRPATDGETVQRQTQRWLIKHGFDMPSVLVLSSSRGKVASALKLDFLIDDSPQHCMDVTSESDAQAVLILRHNDPIAARNARQVGMEVTRTVSAALDLLEQAQATRARPGFLNKIAKSVGLKP